MMESFAKDAKLRSFSALWYFRWATIAVFLGRAWQHLYWDAPYRTLLWDERWMTPIVAAFGVEWEAWVTSVSADQGIILFTRIIGGLFLFAAIAAYSLTAQGGWRKVVVFIAGAWLVFLAILYTKELFFNIGQFFEYSLQFSAPFFLWLLLKKGKLDRKLFFYIRLAIALTFVCHGLYAIGYYPQPGGFVTMVMAGLGLENVQAHLFLHFAGILDFVAAAFILLPSNIRYWRAISLGLGYMVFWGFLTAMARLWSYSFLVSYDTLLLQYLHECIFRFPHFLIPFAMYRYLQPDPLST